jgi:hypothetical protein
MKFNKPYSELCKTIRKRIKIDLDNWRTSVVIEAINKNRGLRKLRQQMSSGSRPIIAIRLQDGLVKRDVQLVGDEIRSFYNQLYRSQDDQPPKPVVPVCAEMPPILEREVVQALKKMKNGTAPGDDKITAEALKLAGDELARPLCRLFNDVISQSQNPNGFADSRTILLYKKDDPQLMANYSPISLLSTLYKLMTRVVTNRLESLLDDAQPSAQAGFRRGYSITDHMQVLNELVEKCHEYNLPLHMLFVDFEKAFDTVEHAALHSAPRRQAFPE